MSTELRQEVEALYPRRRQWFRRRKAVRGMEVLEADLAAFSGRPDDVSEALTRALSTPFEPRFEFTYDVSAAVASLRAAGEAAGA